MNESKNKCKGSSFMLGTELLRTDNYATESIGDVIGSNCIVNVKKDKYLKRSFANERIRRDIVLSDRQTQRIPTHELHNE